LLPVKLLSSWIDHTQATQATTTNGPTHCKQANLPSSCIHHTQAKQQHMEKHIANKQTNLPSSWIIPKPKQQQHLDQHTTSKQIFLPLGIIPKQQYLNKYTASNDNNKTTTTGSSRA